ncbi:MAG TPA: hypothetical protein DD735_08940 [Clostridiales bacterium]|nr:hypothetical protein [Clostridiales bacterium]
MQATTHNNCRREPLCRLHKNRLPRAGKEKSMKALKNDSTIYVDQIEHAVADCYAKNAEPSNTELMRLYYAIGHCICAQGEKAFVVHLAEILAVRLPQVKGFSPRNLRRMRDLYSTYENSPELMHKAQTLGWTQNVIILECCENNEQRSYYIDLVINKDLSKLSLMREIETDAFEYASRQHDDMEQKPGEMSAPVIDASNNPGADKAPVVNAACGPFVAACEPLRQGSGSPLRTERNNSDADERHCGLKGRDTQSKAKLTDAKRFQRTKCLSGSIGRWLSRIDAASLGKQFRIGEWIGGSPPEGWRCPWKTPERILLPT